MSVFQCHGALEDMPMLMRTATHPTAPRHSTAMRSRNGLPAPHAKGSSLDLIGAPMPFARNVEIYGEDEPAEYLYKVISGAVRTYRVLHDGRRQIGAFLLPGDMFGLEAGAMHCSSAEAIADSIILVIKRSAVIALAERDADVARQLWTVTAEELARVQNHMLLLIR